MQISSHTSEASYLYVDLYSHNVPSVPWERLNILRTHTDIVKSSAACGTVQNDVNSVKL